MFDDDDSCWIFDEKLLPPAVGNEYTGAMPPLMPWLIEFEFWIEDRCEPPPTTGYV